MRLWENASMEHAPLEIRGQLQVLVLILHLVFCCPLLNTVPDSPKLSEVLLSLSQALWWKHWCYNPSSMWVLGIHGQVLIH